MGYTNSDKILIKLEESWKRIVKEKKKQHLDTVAFKHTQVCKASSLYYQAIKNENKVVPFHIDL